jgi:glucose/arabinose dehydrogenase
MTRRREWPLTLLAALVLALVARPAAAVFHLSLIDEVLTSYGGDPTAQFVEIRMLSPFQNVVGNSVLAAFDASGAYVGDLLVVPGNVTNQGAGVRWLMATTALETAASIAADFEFPAGLLTGGGMVCWGAPTIVPPAPGTWDHSLIQACHLNHFQACSTNPQCTGAGNFCENSYVDCVAYGTYSGPSNVLTGTPTTLDADGRSVVRATDVHNNATAFVCADPATPTANDGSAGSLAASPACGVTTTTTTSTTLPPPLTNPLPNIPTGTVRIDLETVVDGLVSPLGVVPATDATGRLFVYDQSGTVRIIQANGLLAATPFLDVSARLVPLGAFGPGSYDERGLLGFALHPSFASNGKVYTYTSEPLSGTADFTTPVPATMDHQSVIAEWKVSTGDPNAIDTSTRRELLRIDKPQFNHNAGTLRFGPDGFLYFGLGDGGNGDDEGPGHLPITGNAQDTGNVYGKIHRVDVDGSNSANGHYGIPASNPFVGGPGLDEIWAYGLRNPYAFSFDTGTGDLLLGDAGQNQVEEIDLITSGGNYGWRYKEGSFFFVPNGASPGYVSNTPPGPVPGGLTDPIAEYDHDEGVVVIGGFVYRGSAVPALAGRYVTGDFSQGFVAPAGRLFYRDPAVPMTHLAELQLGDPVRPLGLFLKGFGQDLAGEVYVLGSTDLGPFGTSGRVLKILPLADHLLGYKVAFDPKGTPPGTKFPKGVTRILHDQLTTQTCGILKELGVYNPATKNGAAPQRNVHFVSYQTKCPVFTATTKTFFDQFFPAGVPVMLLKPSVLLVPSGKALSPAPTPPVPPAGTNHYLCYKAKGPKLAFTATVTDQFTPSVVVTLKKITQVCAPADKNGEDPGAVADANHYVCYQAKLPTGVKHVKTKVRTNNANFGANSLESKALLELCVPARKD